MITALLDANVLYSAMLRDLFMRLAVGFVFQPKWTERIQAEWVENVLENRPDVAREKIERTCKLMEQWGRDWQVPECESLIATLFLPDTNDRHVLAAAIASQSPIIVTFNLSDFPETALAPYNIRALHPDDFLVELLDATTEVFVSAIQRHRLALKNPPQTPDEYLERFVESGLRKTVSQLEAYRHRI